MFDLDHYIKIFDEYLQTSRYDLTQTIQEIGGAKLITEIGNVLYRYSLLEMDITAATYRIKDQAVATEKLMRYINSNYPAYFCCNDLLSLQVVQTQEPIVPIHAGTQIIEINKDGYIATAIYYMPNKNTYPGELRIMTEHDFKFNKWLKKHVWAKYEDVGEELRKLYEANKITTELDFTNELQKLVKSKHNYKE